MSIADLARWALLGTERGAAPVLPAELTALALPDDPALGLLRQAAWASLCERAGSLGPVAPAPLPECPPEQWPTISAGAARVLREILIRDDPRLTAECLGLMIASRRRLDEEVLPRLLAAARDDGARAAVVSAGGAIGRWLVQINPDWTQPAPASPDAIWSDGILAQRLDWLRRQRQLDADAARERLAAVFAAEPPAARVEWLATLAEHLSQRDEAFLDAVLDDRRKEVRRAAAALLQRLPGSRLVERAWSLAQPLLVIGAGGWLRKASLEVHLPSACSAAMQRDGIDAKAAAGYRGGERSYWLEELLARVPPRRWCEVSGMDAAALWALTRKHEFGDALRRGWLRAACSADALDWIELALTDGFWLQQAPELAQQVATAVGRAANAEQRIAAYLRAHPDQLPDILLDALATPWSPSFSQAALAWLRQRWNALAPKNRDYLLHANLKTAAYALDASQAIDESGWHVNADARAPRALTECFTVHGLRHQFLIRLQQESSPS
jgi:hypothetical protein